MQKAIDGIRAKVGERAAALKSLKEQVGKKIVGDVFVESAGVKEAFDKIREMVSKVEREVTEEVER